MNQWNKTAVSSYQFIERSSGFIGVFEVKHLVDTQGAVVDDYGCITSDLNCDYYGSEYVPGPKQSLKSTLYSQELLMKLITFKFNMILTMAIPNF